MRRGISTAKACLSASGNESNASRSSAVSLLMPLTQPLAGRQQPTRGLATSAAEPSRWITLSATDKRQGR